MGRSPSISTSRNSTSPLDFILPVSILLFPFRLIFRFVRRIMRFIFGSRKSRAGYLVEIRLHGPVKKYTRQIIYDVARKFHVRGNMKRRPVPHITLYGPFTTNDVTRLVASFKEVCGRYAVHNDAKEELIPFNVAGFKSFDGASGKVICLDIVPSQNLVRLTEELCVKLNQFCKGQAWDSQKDKVFHTTIAFRDVGSKHDAIMRYLNNKPVPKTHFPLIRTTLLEPGGKILVEYDLIQNRLLSRYEAISKDTYLTTINKVKNMIQKR